MAVSDITRKWAADAEAKAPSPALTQHDPHLCAARTLGGWLCRRRRAHPALKLCKQHQQIRYRSLERVSE